MRFLAAATKSNKPPVECADSTRLMLNCFNEGPSADATPRSIAQDVFDLAEAISHVRAAIIADPAYFTASPEATWALRRAATVFRDFYSTLLPVRVVSRGFEALEALLAVKTKPDGKEECTRWRELMADAHYFQNALHNYAIGFDRGLPTGSETAGSTTAAVVISHAENVILFRGREAEDRTAFDDIFGDGAPDR